MRSFAALDKYIKVLSQENDQDMSSIVNILSSTVVFNTKLQGRN